MNKQGPHVTTILALRQANPKMLLREIGEQVGLSRERVRQILKRVGLPTSTLGTRTCVCGAPSRHRRKDGIESRYCSTACKAAASTKRKAAYLVTLLCETCHKTFWRNRRQVAWHAVHSRFDARFCSKACHGVWLGTTHGMARGWRKPVCKWGHSRADAYEWTDSRGRTVRVCRTCRKARNDARRRGPGWKCATCGRM